ncbi:MAG: hypothetical protein DKT66_28330 [Candidatus Melainabacteria bacterium]|nr:MAG: hypothetical protein DKT66_28330 [Candidatus Melainabacteria bacterium]
MITDDDKAFLNSFEQCSLGSKCWNHAAHIRMAWLVLQQESSFESALERIRQGIKRFNAVNNSIGYHETITVAFARLIDARRIPNQSWQTFFEKNSDLFEKNCLEKFYSPELLSSARDIFLEPDRSPLPLSVNKMVLSVEEAAILFCNIQIRPRNSASIKQLIPFVKSNEIQENTVSVTFPKNVREELQSFVAAERLCCSSLVWDILDEDKNIVLKVAGNKEQAAVVFAWFEE